LFSFLCCKKNTRRERFLLSNVFPTKDERWGVPRDL
jgi:hypothetical protein